jgi:hypothetical protein
VNGIIGWVYPVEYRARRGRGHRKTHGGSGRGVHTTAKGRGKKAPADKWVAIAGLWIKTYNVRKFIESAHLRVAICKIKINLQKYLYKFI